MTLEEELKDDEEFKIYQRGVLTGQEHSVPSRETLGRLTKLETVVLNLASTVERQMVSEEKMRNIIYDVIKEVSKEWGLKYAQKEIEEHVRQLEIDLRSHEKESEKNLDMLKTKINKMWYIAVGAAITSATFMNYLLPALLKIYK